MKAVLAVFQAAQGAVAAGDWETLFGLLDESALQAIGGNSLLWLASQDQALWAEFPSLAVEELRDHTFRILESAKRVRAAPMDMGLSLAHRDLVKKQNAWLKRAVKGQAPALGRIESLRRRLGVGGSVSSQLFLNESLQDVVVQGHKAVATRVYASGSSEKLQFVRRGEEWKIHLTR